MVCYSFLDSSLAQPVNHMTLSYLVAVMPVYRLVCRERGLLQGTALDVRKILKYLEEKGTKSSQTVLISTWTRSQGQSW